MSGVVIVPGLNNSGPEHWQTLWQQRLPNAERIHLPRWDQPDLERWADAMIAAVHKQRANYLVAHSFGCLAAVHAIAALQRSVRAVLLVAPADPWLSWSKAQQWAQRWELPIYCAGDAGHINAESRHGDWPEGWKLLQRLLRIGKTAPRLTPAQQSLQRTAHTY